MSVTAPTSPPKLLVSALIWSASDHAGLGQLEGGAPLGHGRPGLFGGAVEGDAHLGGILGKAQQFLARHGGPPGGGHDLGDPLGRHRDARAHLQNVVGHLGKGLGWEN
jgi:hypothetical protein